MEKPPPPLRGKMLFFPKKFGDTDGHPHFSFSFQHGRGLAGLWLRRPGGIGRDHWLCQSRYGTGRGLQILRFPPTPQ